MKRKRDDLRGMRRRPTLDREVKETLVAVLIRNEDAHTTVRDILSIEQFGRFDAGLALAYKIACDFYDEFGMLPDYELLRSEIQEAMVEDPAALDLDEVKRLNDFLEYAFDEDAFEKGDVATSRVYTQWAIKKARRFLQDHLAEQVQHTIVNADGVVEDVAALFAKCHERVEAIDALAGSKVIEPFPEGWDHRGGIPLVSTGIPFIDPFLGGGHAPGEVYVAMGPYGSCKTTLAVMGVVEAALHGWTTAQSDPTTDRVGIGFLLSYEAPVDNELRLRALSYAARIHRDSLETMEHLGSLSTSKHLKDYEKKLFRVQLAKGEKVLGERDRARRAMTWLNQHLCMIDMTGNDPDHRGAGGGFVEEAARAVAAECRRRNAYPTAVWVDHADAMTDAYMASAGLDPKEKTEKLKHLPLRARRQIAVKLSCPVWIMHQLTGEANSRSPGTRMKYTDASGCKAFGQYADFVFTIGTLTKDSLGVFACEKHRRKPPMADTIIRVDGAYHRVRGTRGKYMVSPDRRGIISVEDARVVGGPGATKYQRASGSANQVDIEDD